MKGLDEGATTVWPGKSMFFGTFRGLRNKFKCMERKGFSSFHARNGLHMAKLSNFLDIGSIMDG